MTFWDWLLAELPTALLGAFIGAILSAIATVLAGRKFLLVQQLRRKLLRRTAFAKIQLELAYRPGRNTSEVLVQALQAFNQSGMDYHKESLSSEKAVFRTGTHLHQFVRLPNGGILYRFGPARLLRKEVAEVFSFVSDRLDFLKGKEFLGDLANAVADATFPFACAEVHRLPVKGTRLEGYEVAVRDEIARVSVKVLPNRRAVFEAPTRETLLQSLSRFG